MFFRLDHKWSYCCPPTCTRAHAQWTAESFLRVLSSSLARTPPLTVRNCIDRRHRRRPEGQKCGRRHKLHERRRELGGHGARELHGLYAVGQRISHVVVARVCGRCDGRVNRRAHGGRGVLQVRPRRAVHLESDLGRDVVHFGDAVRLGEACRVARLGQTHYRVGRRPV